MNFLSDQIFTNIMELERVNNSDFDALCVAINSSMYNFEKWQNML